MNVDWQPIETAPTNGTPILIFVHGEVAIATWYSGKYQGVGQPTHWMPLPPAPATDLKGGPT